MEKDYEPDQMLVSLRQGATLEAACRKENIDPEQFKKQMDSNPELTCAVAAAQAEAEIKCAKAIMAAVDKGDWKAAKWWLEGGGHKMLIEKDNERNKRKGPRKIELTVIKVGRKSPRKNLNAYTPNQSKRDQGETETT